MKHLKMFGMVALAALALAAFAASSASAAKVCSTAGAGATCESGHGKVYTGAISATAAAPGAVLTVTAIGSKTAKAAPGRSPA